MDTLVNLDITATVGKLAASDYRKAQVFKRFGLEFCCGGRKTLEQACHEKNISVEEVKRELLSSANSRPGINLNYNDWNLGFLVDFIVTNHHQYIKKSVKPLEELADKVAKAHGHQHPTLIRIATTFKQIAADLSAHLIKEEEVLFPYIRSLVQQRADKTERTTSFGLIRQSVNMMVMEHEATGEHMKIINTLTNNYEIPSGSCVSYSLLFKWLKEFEEDLHIHVHLENNILFPKALDLETKVL